MAGKTLLELLNKYVPNQDYIGILRSGVVTKTRVDKESRILEVYADFSHVIKKEDIYALEEEVKAAYELKHLSFFRTIRQSFFQKSGYPMCLRRPSV